MSVMQFESHKAFQKWGENIESFRTLTAATIRAEKAAKMTQRSRATNCHIRPSARHKVTGLAKYLTSTSSEKLHQFPPGKIDGRNSKNFLSLSAYAQLPIPNSDSLPLTSAGAVDYVVCVLSSLLQLTDSP